MLFFLAQTVGKFAWIVLHLSLILRYPLDSIDRPNEIIREHEENTVAPKCGLIITVQHSPRCLIIATTDAQLYHR